MICVSMSLGGVRWCCAAPSPPAAVVPLLYCAGAFLNPEKALALETFSSVQFVVFRMARTQFYTHENTQNRASIGSMHTTLIPSVLSPKRDCGPKRDNQTLLSVELGLSAVV